LVVWVLPDKSGCVSAVNPNSGTAVQSRPALFLHISSGVVAVVIILVAVSARFRSRRFVLHAPEPPPINSCLGSAFHPGGFTGIHILKRRRDPAIVLAAAIELHSSPGSAGIQIYKKDPGSRLVFLAAICCTTVFNGIIS